MYPDLDERERVMKEARDAWSRATEVTFSGSATQTARLVDLADRAIEATEAYWKAKYEDAVGRT